MGVRGKVHGLEDRPSVSIVGDTDQVGRFVVPSILPDPLPTIAIESAAREHYDLDFAPGHFADALPDELGLLA